MMKAETNTVAMQARVVVAAHKRGLRNVRADYEHGQWWIVARDSGAVYAVVDAEGRSAVNGFDFEEVT